MAGRPGKYKTHIEPYLEQISLMSIDHTEQEIARKLGIAYSIFRKYKRQYSALSDALSHRTIATVKDREEELNAICDECINTLVRCARGYTYEETKVIKEGGKVKREEITTKHAKPDPEAIKLLLSNYKEGWSNDPERNKMRREELELKKKLAEQEAWLDSIAEEQ